MADGSGRFKTPETRQKSLDALRQSDGLRWRGRLNVPTHCHPLVKRLYQLMNENGKQLGEMADECNISRTTLWGWAHQRMPVVDMLDAAFNSLGYRLMAVPIPEEAVAAEHPWIPIECTNTERALAVVLRDAYPRYLTMGEMSALSGVHLPSMKVNVYNMKRKGLIFESDKSGHHGKKHRLSPANFTPSLSVGGDGLGHLE